MHAPNHCKTPRELGAIASKRRTAREFRAHQLLRAIEERNISTHVVRVVGALARVRIVACASSSTNERQSQESAKVSRAQTSFTPWKTSAQLLNRVLTVLKAPPGSSGAIWGRLAVRSVAAGRQRHRGLLRRGASQSEDTTGGWPHAARTAE